MHAPKPDPTLAIDPEIAACIAATAGLPVSDVSVMAPQEARAAYAAGRVPWNRGGPVMAETRHHAISTPDGEVAAVAHRPADAQPGTVVYLHGGGWVTGSIETHDGIMRRLASCAQRQVVGLDYPLAPEARRSRILAACVAAVRSIMEGGEPVILAGDSAGGELALSTALALRDDGLAGPRGLALLYPALWPRFDGPAHRRSGGGAFGLTTAKMRAFWSHYLGEDEGSLDAAPDLGGLPPCFVLGAALDCLLDDALDLSRLLAASNVSHDLSVPAGTVHGFLHYSAKSALAMAAHRRLGDFVRARFAADP